jgi:hypothetical protein
MKMAAAGWVAGTGYGARFVNTCRAKFIYGTTRLK